MEIRNQSDVEFKTLVIRMLKENSEDPQQHKKYPVRPQSHKPQVLPRQLQCALSSSSGAQGPGSHPPVEREHSEQKAQCPSSLLFSALG